ncbi:MAG: HD domain-containing protein [Bradyrhizobiaceae bacterium]|nr:MAG: HD domain-containing protein [Bradyrhizobiaceae bacterium]
MARTIAGIRIPDSVIARQAEELIKDNEPEFLFNHSVRVYLFGALRGQHLKQSYDEELLYIASLFHDLGLIDSYTSAAERFEVDGANAARDFLNGHGIAPDKISLVWEAIALHTTPGIPQHMRPEIALTRAGVRMDVVGTDFESFTAQHRDEVIAAYPRHDFKNAFIDIQASSARSKPMTTFGTINSDYIEWVDPGFKRVNQCENILKAPWKD